MMLGGNAPRYHRLHISVSSQAAPLNLTYLPLYISNISPHIAPRHQKHHGSNSPQPHHQAQSWIPGLDLFWVDIIDKRCLFTSLIFWKVSSLWPFVKSVESCCSNSEATIEMLDKTIMRPNVHTLSCWNVGAQGGLGRLGSRWSKRWCGWRQRRFTPAWNPLLPLCFHSGEEFRESASPPLTALPCHPLHATPWQSNWAQWYVQALQYVKIQCKNDLC